MIMLGDFNLYKQPPMYPRAPEIDRRIVASDTNSRPNEAAWKEIVGQMVELDNELPTHFVANEWQPKLTQIDRIFMSLASWQVLQWHVTVTTPDMPEDLHERGLSDHAPVIATIAARAYASPTEQPLPLFIFKDPEFAVQYQRLAAATDWHSQTAYMRRATHKRLMKEAGL